MGWVTDEDGEKRWAVVFSDNDRELLGAAEVKSCVARGARLSAVANAAAQEQQLQKHAVAWTQTRDVERARSAARDKTLRNGSPGLFSIAMADVWPLEAMSRSTTDPPAA